MQDINGYLSRMNTTIIDKLFWTKHIFEPVSQLVDVGCADGTLLKVFSLISPNTSLIGIDDNSQMREKVINSGKNIRIFPDLSNLEKLDQGSVLNLSSVLHEIYSYNNASYIDNFWENILRLEPEYITVRDMYCASNLNGYSIGVKNFKNKILSSQYKDQLKEFEEYWGEITEISSLTHFLLKYEYKENWKRELKENYFSWNLNNIEKKIGEKYQVVYIVQEQLPYFLYKIKRDFEQEEFPFNTHIKIIFKKKS